MSTIIGTAGSDTLLGTPSDDYIDTGGGTDSVDAGAGNDTIRLTIVTPPGNQSFGTVDAGAGDDTVQFLGGSGRVSREKPTLTIFSGRVPGAAGV